MFVIQLLSVKFIIQTRALGRRCTLFGVYLNPSCEPKQLFFKEYDGAHRGEAVKLSWVPSKCLHLLLLPETV